jgi:hypothetical protein
LRATTREATFVDCRRTLLAALLAGAPPLVRVRAVRRQGLTPAGWLRDEGARL